MNMVDDYQYTLATYMISLPTQFKQSIKDNADIIIVNCDSELFLSGKLSKNYLRT